MTATSDRDVLAIDIGGTKIALAIVNCGRVMQRIQIATPRSGMGADVIEAIAEQAALLPSTAATGVATTGIVEGGCLTALNPATLPIEDRYPIAAALEARLSRRVLAINDAQAAAWAEHSLGAGKGADRMAFITVSTGIGAGIVLDGELQFGARGLAGHVGHMASDPSGPQCGCGRHGCIERLASGSAIGILATELTGRKLSSPDVFILAEKGDEACRSLLTRVATSLANTMCDLVASLDLDRIVLGGGVGLADGFLERVRTAMTEQPAIFRRPVVGAGLAADAGLIGAALLVDDGKFYT